MLKETRSDLVIVRGPHSLLYGSQPNVSVIIDGDLIHTGQSFAVVTNFSLLGLEQQVRSLQATTNIGEWHDPSHK